MFDLTLETAKVVSIEDKDKQGKIQINIESKFKNIKKDLLPWAIPLFSDICSDTMSMNLPSVDSQVWILRDKYWKRFYYLTNRYFYNLFDFSNTCCLISIFPFKALKLSLNFPFSLIVTSKIFIYCII